MPPETHQRVDTCVTPVGVRIFNLISSKFGKRVTTNKPIKWFKHCDRKKRKAWENAKVWIEGYHKWCLATNEYSNPKSTRDMFQPTYEFLLSIFSFYLNNRVFLSWNYRLIVAPRKFDVLKTNILVLRTSNFQVATIRLIVPRHKHSIVFIVHLNFLPLNADQSNLYSCVQPVTNVNNSQRTLAK